MSLPQPEAVRISKMMLVDDNDFDQAMYKRIVTRAGIVNELVQFTRAQDALAYLKDPDVVRPDVVLLDINMPGMDGFGFLEHASDEIGPDMCPVIVMLTTSLNPKDEERARAFEIVKDFYSKPLTEALLHELSGLLRSL